MAGDTRKITIEILGVDSGGSGKKETSASTKISNKKQTKKMKGEIAKAESYKKAAEQVYNTAVKVADFNMNRYFTFSEDYISNTTYNNVKASIAKGKQWIETGTSVATMIASGNYVGAAATIGTSVINEGMEYYQRMSGYYQSLNATNYQTGFSATRAGLVNDSRGTEN